jgi:hypothetical protein
MRPIPLFPNRSIERSTHPAEFPLTPRASHMIAPLILLNLPPARLPRPPRTRLRCPRQQPCCGRIHCYGRYPRIVRRTGLALVPRALMYRTLPEMTLKARHDRPVPPRTMQLPTPTRHGIQTPPEIRVVAQHLPRHRGLECRKGGGGVEAHEVGVNEKRAAFRAGDARGAFGGELDE